MSFISYAQNYEDVMLWRALRRVEHGFYIDVGAAWPDQDSVTKHFYRQGWHGINIEPNPTLFQQYSRERPDDINLQVAVSDEPGETEIYMVADTGLSSLSHEVVKDHVRLGYAYHSERVQVLTLQEICKEYVKGRDVHFLKIDVEGWEERVLKSNDWGYCRPWIVVVEATKPMTEVESYSASESILLKIGYRFVYADGLNRYYVSPEHIELVASFRYPPNVFDRFIPYREFLLNKKIEGMGRDQLSAKRAAEQRVQHLQVELSQSYARMDQTVRVLEDVYASTSWRVTAPFRWVTRQVFLLRQLGIRSRLIALLRRPLCLVFEWVEARPALKQRVATVSRSCGLFPYLKLAHGRVRQSYVHTHQVACVHRESDLTPRAQSVYRVLLAAYRRKRGGH